MKKGLLFLIFAAPLAAAQDTATVFQSEEVAPGIFYLTGATGFVGGGVSLLVGDEYVVLIDDALHAIGDELLTEIKNIAGRPADFVISTHLHGDHTGSNQLMASQGAIIVAHDNVHQRMMTDEQLNTGPGALPVISFNDRVTFHINDQEAVVFHLENAHTDGDAAIIFPDANVIASGDIVFRGMFPYIDLDSGGSVAGYKKAMQTLIDKADDETKILSGHGGVATRSGLMTDLAMLIDAEARVKVLVDQSVSADDIVAANPLAVYHDDYDWAFITTERMTRTLIRSLTTD